jgi:hypothetical protein
MLSELLAKYPFLSSARNALGDSAVSEEELENAVSFIKSVLTREPSVVDAVINARAEVRQHAIARLLLYAFGDASLLAKYAEQRARNAVSLLRDSGELVQVARDFFPSLQERTGEYSVSLADFLRNSKPEAGLQLVSSNFDSGSVFLSQDELLLLLKEGIKARVKDFTAAGGLAVQRIPAAVRQAAQELRDALPQRVAPAFKTKFLGLECIRNLLKGIPEGHRYYGAMALSIACVKDGLPREQAAELLKEYAANCKGVRPFTAREALATLDWTYKHPSIGFSCKMLREHGLLAKNEYCRNCVLKRGRSEVKTGRRFVK